MAAALVSFEKFPLHGGNVFDENVRHEKAEAVFERPELQVMRAVFEQYIVFVTETAGLQELAISPVEKLHAAFIEQENIVARKIFDELVLLNLKRLKRARDLVQERGIPYR